MMKRRDALKTIGGLGAAAGLARLVPGCGGGDGGPTGITTYVYMMMENRSYDHFFGARSMLEGMGGDGITAAMSNKDLAGNPVALFHPDQLHLCDLDPPHGWESSRAEWNLGKNDGFVTTHQMEHSNPTAIDPMQYLTRNELPISWALADKYATADRWFCSVMGPTWPNRFYWHTASSGGLTTNELPMGLDWPSIYHRLQDAGIDWAYYFGSIPVVSAINGLNVDGKVKRFAQFIDDAKAGKLPPVVYIDPAFYQNDDHPPIHPINGQELVASVYKALAESPQWKNCMLVITYDEHGGFFDHVSPGKTVDERAAQGFDQLGFRVPTVVAGPYIKEGYVSSTVYEHCSALHEIELAFGLPSLNARTAAANDLSDFIDMDRLAKGKYAKPIELPTVDTSQWPMDQSCKYTSGSSREASHDVIAWANRYPHLIKGYDLRDELPEYRRVIRDFLKKPWNPYYQ